jgi:hypothetical protein
MAASRRAHWTSPISPKTRSDSSDLGRLGPSVALLAADTSAERRTLVDSFYCTRFAQFVTDAGVSYVGACAACALRCVPDLQSSQDAVDAIFPGSIAIPISRAGYHGCVYLMYIQFILGTMGYWLRYSVSQFIESRQI